MKTVRKALSVLLCLFPLLSGFIPGEAGAGGRAKPSGDQAQSMILWTSWYRDTAVHVAIANAGYQARPLKVSVGTKDRQARPYASQSLVLPPRAITLVYFPVSPALPGPGGHPDHAMLSGPGAAGPFDHAPIQQPAGAPSPSLDHFLARPGDSVLLRYETEPGNGRQLLFLPRTVGVQGATVRLVEPSGGIPRLIGRDTVEQLDLPAVHRPAILRALDEGVGFYVPPGERVEFSLRYAITEVGDCAIVRLSETRYEFLTGGGVRTGTGSGVAFLVYDPRRIKLLPLHAVTAERDPSPVKKSSKTE